MCFACFITLKVSHWSYNSQQFGRVSYQTFSNCRSRYVTVQHNTLRGKCCLPSSAYIGLEKLVFGWCCCDLTGERGGVCHPSHPKNQTEPNLLSWLPAMDGCDIITSQALCLQYEQLWYNKGANWTSRGTREYLVLIALSLFPLDSFSDMQVPDTVMCMWHLCM